MISKNDVITAVVSDVGANGEGIIKYEGIVVFVPYALTGEKVKCLILKVNKKFAFGKVIEVLTPAEERVKPLCSVYAKCGGCALQHVKYVEQLKIKEKNVLNCLEKIGGIKAELKSTVKSPEIWNYRNKLQLPVRKVNGENVIGFFAENSHRVVKIDTCLINAEYTGSLIKAFYEYVNENNLSGYDEETLQGDIREFTVKEIADNLIITVVTLRKDVKGINELSDIIKKHIRLNFSLYQNVNSADTNVIYGEEFYLLYGKPSYSAKMFNVEYEIGVQSFMQVNTKVCSKLYSYVRDCFDAEDLIIDAYSGAGLMTAIVSEKAKRAIGVEVIKEAVECADKLMIANGLQEKVKNYCGKCEEILPQIIEKERGQGKIGIIIDPPRKGCEKQVLQAIINSGADKIVYVSCMPSTLARDLGILTGNCYYDTNDEIKKAENSKPIYQVHSVRLFDMFAQTKHVETVCVLTKK